MKTLSLFDKINLAKCAAERAMMCSASDRFYAEYNTARLWFNHNVLTLDLQGSPVSFVDKGF
jgi:hypothetical protein